MIVSNSPREQITISVEARKSFALDVVLRDAHGTPVNLTATAFRLGIGQPQRSGEVTPVLVKTGVVIDAARGRARFELQARELDLEPRDYSYTLVSVRGGYSSVLLKGVLRVVQNTEWASATEDFAFAQPPQQLDLTLQARSDVHVTLGHQLPGDVLRVPPGGAVGQFLGKPSADPLDIAWMSLQGGLSATGVPAGSSPRADGAGAWAWEPVAGQSQVDQLGADVATLQSGQAALSTRIDATDVEVASIDARLSAREPYLDGLPAEIAALWMNDDVLRLLIQRAAPVGSMQMYAGGVIPETWLLCDGRVLTAADHPALAAVLGATYGGNGTTTFGLPDMRGRTPVGVSPGDSDFGVLNRAVGSKTHTLTIPEMPSHSHQQYLPLANYSGTLEGHSGAWGKHSGAMIGLGSTGGGGAHNNIQPSRAVHFIIKA